jgi:hypothetical protein
VQDLPEVCAFYRDKLGLAPLPAPPGVSAACWQCFDVGTVQLALQAGGRGRSGPDAPRLVFRVQDMEAAREVLLGRGVELGEVHAAQPGVQVCCGADPEGNLFQLEARD